MNHYGVILRKLRELNQLSMKQAAAKIERSAGWLSEIENNKGAARIHREEFERIVAAYGGNAHRKQFGIWVAKAQKPEKMNQEISYGGAVLKFLRKKVKMTLVTAASEAGLSKSYLSYIEIGTRPVTASLRDKLMRIYGYSPTTFKNFATEDKRGKNIPALFKLEILLRKMDDDSINRVLAHAIQTFTSAQDCAANR